MSPNENSSSNSNAYYVNTDGTINNGNNNSNNVTNSYGFRPCVALRHVAEQVGEQLKAVDVSNETLSYPCCAEAHDMGNVPSTRMQT